MKPKKSIYCLVGALSISAAVSFAQEGEPKGPRPGGEGRPGGRLTEFLMRADSNGDGKISKEEFNAVSRGGGDAEERFARMDANSDGFVDKTEIEAVGDRLRDGMRGRGPGGDGEGGFRRPPEGEASEGGRPRGPRGPGDGERPDGPPGGGMPIDEIFGRMDKNSDGVVDKEEYMEFSKEEVENRFARADGNNDGKLTKEEVKAGAERMRSMQQRGPGGPDGGFRRGPEGGRPGEGRPESGGFRRPPSQGEGEGKARPEFEKAE